MTKGLTFRELGFLRPRCKASSRHTRHWPAVVLWHPGHPEVQFPLLVQVGEGKNIYKRKQLYLSRIGLRGQRQHSIVGKLNLHKPAIGTSAAGKLQDTVFYSPGTISQAELKPHRTLCFKKNYTRSRSRLFQNVPPDLRRLQSLYILQLFLRTPMSQPLPFSEALYQFNFPLFLNLPVWGGTDFANATKLIYDLLPSSIVSKSRKTQL